LLQKSRIGVFGTTDVHEFYTHNKSVCIPLVPPALREDRGKSLGLLMLLWEECMKIFLETERLILRQFTQDDANNLFELDSDLEVIRFTPDAGKPKNYTVIKTQLLPRFFAYYEQYDNYGVWATIEKSSQAFIGWFYFRPAVHASYFNSVFSNESDVEIGYRLQKAAWGKGYATEGSKALIFKGFSELGTQRVVSVALAANVASIRVLEKAGLKLENRFVYEGHGQEVLIYALNKDEFKLEKYFTT
jgi:RimJ/RimL family protein N-acetyltransferase